MLIIHSEHDKNKESRPEKSCNYLAPALIKGLEVLELLAVASKPLTVNQIANNLNRSISEIYRVIIRLRMRGYLNSPKGSKLISLSNKALAFAPPLSNREIYRNLAISEMKGLTETTGQSCHLSTLSNNKVVVVANIYGEQEFEITMNPGSADSVLGSFCGAVIYSAANKAIRDEIRDNIKDAEKSKLPEFLTHVEHVVNKGYSINKLLNLNVLAVSVPLIRHQDEVSALTSIIIPEKNPKLSLDDVIQHTLKVAKSIRLHWNFLFVD